MPKVVRDERLESPTARSKLMVAPTAYWRALEPEIHIGYRKGARGGRWVARWYLRHAAPVHTQGGGDGYKHQGGKAYHHETLPGLTDDNQPADGGMVLSFAQAQKRVRELFAAANAEAHAGAPITVRMACDTYIKYLQAEKKTAIDARQRLERNVYPDLSARQKAVEEKRAEIARLREKYERLACIGNSWAIARLTRLAAREAALATEAAAIPSISIGDRLVAELTTKELDEVKRAMVRRDPNDPEVERRSKDTANRTMTSLKAALNACFADPKNRIPSDAAWRRVRGGSEKLDRLVKWTFRATAA